MKLLSPKTHAFEAFSEQNVSLGASIFTHYIVAVLHVSHSQHSSSFTMETSLAFVSSRFALQLSVPDPACIHYGQYQTAGTAASAEVRCRSCALNSACTSFPWFHGGSSYLITSDVNCSADSPSFVISSQAINNGSSGMLSIIVNGVAVKKAVLLNPRVQKALYTVTNGNSCQAMF